MHYLIYLSTNTLLPFIKFIIDNKIANNWKTQHHGSYLNEMIITNTTEFTITNYYKISFCTDEEYDIIEAFKESDVYDETMYINLNVPLTNDIIF